MRTGRRQELSQGRLAAMLVLASLACSQEPEPGKRNDGEPGKVIVKAEPVAAEQPALPRAGNGTNGNDAGTGAEIASPRGGGASGASGGGTLLPASPRGGGASGASGGGTLLPTSPLPDFAATYERVAPSVVKISTYGKDPLNGTPTPLAMGTGFFFGSPGRILTNAHVVAGGSSFDVELFDGNRVPARLVGRDQLTDLALLAVSEAPAPAPLPPAPPESLAAGMWVMAIGNPLGLEFSATKGIISALNRTDVLWDRVGYWDFIQTDAPINVGNSGGPLVDVEGRVIGVCAAIEKHADRVGFAIPISTASVVASHIERYGKLKRAWLGIQIVRAENQLRVVGVYPDSPAHRAGFLPGDVILDLDGLPEEDVGRMRWKIAVHEIDRPATFRIDREGAEFFLTVQLAEADEVLAPDRR